MSLSVLSSQLIRNYIFILVIYLATFFLPFNGSADVVHFRARAFIFSTLIDYAVLQKCGKKGEKHEAQGKYVRYF